MLQNFSERGCEFIARVSPQGFTPISASFGGIVGLGIGAAEYQGIRSDFEKVAGGPIREITLQRQMKETDRSKLDEIVKDMEARNESGSAIQARVDDYKMEHAPTETVRIQRAKIKQLPNGQYVEKSPSEVSAERYSGVFNLLTYAALPTMGFFAPLVLMRLFYWVVGGFSAR